jgi:putative CocE/NonD family hydrolase
LLDMNKLHKEWYDWILKGGVKPGFLKQRVAYYLMGPDEWKYADRLEAISSTHQKLFLNSIGGQANDVYRSGSLEDQPSADSIPDCYTYDPLDVRTAEIEREEMKNYLTDQRYDLNLFGGGLVYHTVPFEEPVEISGSVKLVAWISMDVPDTDFMVTVSEILLDGSRIQLTQDFMRARYRNSLVDEDLITKGKIERYEFKGFTFFSRRIAKGSRLRLVIRSPNSIYIQKNYNSGGAVAEESAKDARTAHITLHHQPEYPSFLEIPVVK